MNQEQFTDLFGKSSKFSDHKAGDTIQFRRGAEIKQGKILHVRAPAPTPVSGTQIGVRYIVDADMGFPVTIAPSQIVEGSLPSARTFPVILASYGFKEHSLKSREEAENLIANVVGQIIDTDNDEGLKRIKVLSARIEEIGEGRGRVIATCEAAQSPFPAIIGSYGAPTNGCTLSRKAAENLSVNVQGQVIDTEQGRLRVLSARIEGDEKAGQVLAECEAVSESEEKS